MSDLFLGYNSFSMPLKKNWSVTYSKEDPTKADVRFETGKYPVLGVKVLSKDDPKLDTKSNLKIHLFDEVLLETHPNLNIKKIAENVYGLEYEANLDSGEKVKVWRIASVIGVRTVRIVTLALSWMGGEAADNVVENILEELDACIKKCRFSPDKTDLDKEADATAKISRLKLKTYKPWEGLKINLPASWLCEINKNEKSMVLKVTGYEDAMFFLHSDEINLSSEIVITNDYMTKIASNLKNDPHIENISLHSTGENMYLISCFKLERIEEENLILKNCFWHIFIAQNKKLYKLNFTYVFPKDNDLFLDNLIDVLDNNIKNLSFS